MLIAVGIISWNEIPVVLIIVDLTNKHKIIKSPIFQITCFIIFIYKWRNRPENKTSYNAINFVTVILKHDMSYI